MNLLSRMFRTTEKKGPTNKIVVYLNSDFKQAIEVEDQPVSRYLESGVGEGKYIFLLVKNKKDSVILKRKLNGYEQFSLVL